MYYPSAKFGDKMSSGFVLESTHTHTHVQNLPLNALLMPATPIIELK